VSTIRGARLALGGSTSRSCHRCVARPVLRTPGEVARDEKIDDLRRQLREAKAQVTDIQGKFDALATVTANPYQENIALKKKLGNSRRLASVPAQR